MNSFPQRIKDRICIVGFADGHRDAAPWQDQGLEFWGINRLHAVLPGKPWTRWFELHSLEEFYGHSAPGGVDQQHIDFLRSFQGPVYVRGQDMDLARDWGIERAEPFPLDALLQKYHPYFTNTVSYLIALAIEMLAADPPSPTPQIQMFGVDMAQDSLLQNEYRGQRPSCEWLLGMAQGRGIEVVLPPGSDLLRASHLYGFSDDAMQKKNVERLNELGARKEQIRQEMNQLRAQADYYQSRISELDGSMQETQYRMVNWGTPIASPPERVQVQQPAGPNPFELVLSELAQLRHEVQSVRSENTEEGH